MAVCAAEEEVVFVGPSFYHYGTTPQDCGTRAVPCPTVAIALELVNSTRRYVRLDFVDLVEPIAIFGKEVVLAGDFFFPISFGNQPLVRIADGARVTMAGFYIDGQQEADVGIECDNATLVFRDGQLRNHNRNAINARGCNIHIEKSEISNNGGIGVDLAVGELKMLRTFVTGNRGGGISATDVASLEVVNNVIARNGSLMSDIGAISVASIGSGSGIIAYNTIVENLLGSSGSSIIDCGLVGRTQVSNNIIHANLVTGDQPDQTIQGCVEVNSNLSDVMLLGESNLLGNPKFIPLPPGDNEGLYYPSADSPAIDQADVDDISRPRDIIGTPRPQGKGPDIGAFEFFGDFVLIDTYTAPPRL